MALGLLTLRSNWRNGSAPVLDDSFSPTCALVMVRGKTMENQSPVLISMHPLKLGQYWMHLYTVNIYIHLSICLNQTYMGKKSEGEFRFWRHRKTKQKNPPNGSCTALCIFHTLAHGRFSDHGRIIYPPVLRGEHPPLQIEGSMDVPMGHLSMKFCH